jgi:hypothetical protein
VLYAVFSPIAWRCNLFSSGDREINGEALWIEPGDARINENILLSKLRLAFTIRARSQTPESGAEERTGALRYDPPFLAAEIGVKHDAELSVFLVIKPEQFADLWDRKPEGIPQRVFVEVEGFRDQYEFVSGDKIWELNPAETAQVLIKTCTFQNRALMRSETRIGNGRDQVIADVTSFVEQHRRERHDSNKPQHSAILKDLYACISREFTLPGEVYRSDLDEEFTKVEQLVHDVDSALNRQSIQKTNEVDGRRDNPSRESLWIWRRGNPVATFQEGLKSPSRRIVDRDGLGEVTLRYLRTSYLRSDLLEWIIVDAFVLHEIQEFGETIKQGKSLSSVFRYWASDGRPRAWISLFTQLILSLVILAGWIAGLAFVTPFAAENTLASLLAFGAYVLFFMWLTGRPVFLRRSERAHSRPMLLPEMMKMYALLDAQAGVISPYAIRNALLDLQTKGAVWDQATLAILDTAAARTPPAWLL